MANAITDTAQLTCNQGTTPSNLSVTSQDFINIENKPIATEADKQPNTNIKPFWAMQTKTLIIRLFTLRSCSTEMEQNLSFFYNQFSFPFA